MTPLTATEIKTTYAEAQRLQAAGKAEDALKAYGRIVEARPDIPEVHFQIGRLFTEAFRTTRAIEHLKAAAALRPAEPAIREAWADAAALSADPDLQADFLSALKSAPVAKPAKLPLQDRFGAFRAKTRPATGGLPPKEVSGLVALMTGGKPAAAVQRAQALLKKAPKAAIVANILGSAQDALGRRDAALAAFQHAVRIDPLYAEAHANLGQLLFDLDRLDAAVAALRRAVTLTPDNVAALAMLGRALTRRGEADLAMRFIDRALALAPADAPALIARANAETRRGDHAETEAALLAAERAAGTLPAEARTLLAQAQTRLGKDDLALENYDRALEHAPDLPFALSGKASLLQTLGRFDAAETCFRRAFATGGASGETYRLFIASHKTQAGDPILAEMQARFDDPATPDEDRAHLGFAIAKALEDIKDYGPVFRYLDTANALVRKANPWDIGLRHAEIAETMRAQDGADFTRTLPGTSDFAPIFVTGMPRSGTTLVEQIIASHSQVEGAGEVGSGTRMAQTLLNAGDGVSYRPVSDLADDEIAALGHDYAALMRARFPDAPVVTDKSIQTYLFIGLMKLALPRARFIVVRRDPRDTLLSIYRNKFPDGTHLYAYDQRDLARYWRTFEQMIGFWRARTPDLFYEVGYEALVANPEEESRKLIDACGLPWEDACLNFHENKRKVETLSVYQVRQPISRASLKGWQRYEADLAPMLEELGEVDDAAS